ncbi:MarR family transcriptional regulator [Brevundimonas sp. M20]|nr:MarR family transcriptional regulator [Brevundimonas sp. M20]
MPYDLREALRPETERAAHELNAAYKLVIAARRWRARLTDILKRDGASDSDFSVLYHLAAAPTGLKQGELAERMGVRGPTLTRLLDGLEARGWVRRGEIIGDRRFKLIKLTTLGCDTVRDLDPLARSLRDHIFDGCTDEQIIAFQAMLDRILERSAAD